MYALFAVIFVLATIIAYLIGFDHGYKRRDAHFIDERTLKRILQESQRPAPGEGGGSSWVRNPWGPGGGGGHWPGSGVGGSGGYPSGGSGGGASGGGFAVAEEWEQGRKLEGG